MAARKINGTRLRTAIQSFGSLEKAIISLRRTKAVLEKQNEQLRQQISLDEAVRNSLSNEIKSMSATMDEQKEQYRILSEATGNHRQQYELFQGFMTMLVSSPSVNDSIESLIDSLKRLLSPGWQLTRSNEAMRTLFIRTVLGDYLKCFQCTRCGSRFILNQTLDKQYRLYPYHCPVCHYSDAVKTDESFLKALVSQEQLDNIHLVEQLLEENTNLKPLRVFLDVPCEICGKPITNWSEGSVKAAVMGFG